MMTDVLTPNKSRAYAFYAAIGLWVSTFLANITFNIFGYGLELTFLPIAVLFLWPNGAEPNISYAGIFLSGITMDLLNGDAIGGWSFIFLIFYGILSLFNTGRQVNLLECWFNFALSFSALMIGFMLAEFFGVLDANYRDLMIVGAACFLLFPVIFKFRKFLRTNLVGDD